MKFFMLVFIVAEPMLRHMNATRAAKAQSSKLPLARLTSIFAKLDNQLAKEAMVNKNKREKANA